MQIWDSQVDFKFEKIFESSEKNIPVEKHVNVVEGRNDSAIEFKSTM